MRVYMNFTPRNGPYGGANAFLRTLMAELGRRGVVFTADEREPVDVALLNALTDGLMPEDVERIASRGTPIVHRKTGFRARGAPGLRAVVEGVVLGDAHQVAFSPFVSHSVFQSAYSREVFVAAGFEGPSSVIPNGVDDSVFHPGPAGASSRATAGGARAGRDLDLVDRPEQGLRALCGDRRTARRPPRRRGHARRSSAGRARLRRDPRRAAAARRSLPPSCARSTCSSPSPSTSRARTR